MTDSLAGVVLAAGSGTRLRPLTRLRPKALCPVDDVPLVDLALERLAQATTSVAVNVHHGRAAMESHLCGRVHLSIEEPVALGTAGGLGRLKDWIDGRPVLVTNVDTWLPRWLDLRSFAGEWDGLRPRLLVVRDPRRGTWGDLHYVGVSLLPWQTVARLSDEPSGLYERCWRQLGPEGIEFVHHSGPFFDCGTLSDYLAANLAASGGMSVVGRGAEVLGEVVRSVVWPAAFVAPSERLVDAIRADDRVTVLVRRPSASTGVT